MTVCLLLKISKHASVLSNDPLMHSNSTRFKKRSSIPLVIWFYNKNTPTPQIITVILTIQIEPHVNEGYLFDVG